MSFVPEKIDSLWDEIVVPRILEQYKYSSNWQACLKCVVDRIQKVEDGVFLLYRYFKVPFRYDEVSSGTLEYVASLVNVIRQDGESDQQLFDRFILRISSNKAGTPDHVIFNAVKKSGDVNLAYMDEAPATFFVYTPNGKQLMQSDVQRYAPAGVLGLPGAAIQFADGSFMGDAEGKIILAVADDENIEPEPGPVPDKIVIGGLPYRVGEMPDGRVWMLENLQLDVPDSWFYDNDESSYGRTGKNYGRLYTWNAAMSIVVPGWHVPSRAEWEQLINSVGGERECKKLTSASFGGTDDFGFNALFGGMRGDDGDFLYVGQEANFISSSETGSRYCDNMCLNESYFYADDYGKTHGCSVRLIQDV